MAIAGELPEGGTQKATFRKGAKGPTDQRGGVRGNQGGTAGVGGEARAVSVTLLYKLQTTMHAILVPVHPPLRMFFYAAFLNENLRVYHFATVRAPPDGGVRAPVIKVSTSPVRGILVISTSDPLVALLCVT